MTRKDALPDDGQCPQGRQRMKTGGTAASWGPGHSGRWRGGEEQGASVRGTRTKPCCLLPELTRDLARTIDVI